MNEQETSASAHNYTSEGGQGQPYQPQHPYNSPQSYGQQPQQQQYGQYSLPPVQGQYSSSTGASSAQMGRERVVLAAILIGAGLLFFVQQVTPFDFGDFVMPVVGAAFIAAYMNTRAAYRVGFLIPGCILLGIGVGNLLESYSPLGQWGWFDVSGLMLGLGFCLIWGFDRRQWWALIPGGILAASSLANFWVVTKLWPLALVGLGGYLLYEQYRRKQRS